MKRKLIAVMLSVFAMLLLMGAADNIDQSAALLAEEESPVSEEMGLEAEAQLPDEIPEAERSESGNWEMGASGLFGSSIRPPVAPSIDPELPVTPPVAPSIDPELPVTPPELPSIDPELPVSPPVEITGDDSLLINGEPAPLELNKEMQNGVTYVALSVMARQLAPTAQINWDGSAASVVTDQLSLTAQVGEYYVEANGRYLYVAETVQLSQAGQVIVPLRVVAKAFGAEVGYDAGTGITTVASGSGTIQSGSDFYNQDDLFWISRVIQRESGNQSMKGKMAVGNVVLNRVADPAFPDTIEGVLAQRNQFTTYQSGALAATDPSDSCIVAAKLVLDGGVVEETRGALFFDSNANSWAAKNKQLIATIGGHQFYG